jgi:hypothetical protein
MKGAVPAAEILDPPIAFLDEKPGMATRDDRRSVSLERNRRARITADYGVGGINPISPLGGLIEEGYVRHWKESKSVQQLGLYGTK